MCRHFSHGLCRRIVCRALRWRVLLGAPPSGRSFYETVMTKAALGVLQKTAHNIDKKFSAQNRRLLAVIARTEQISRSWSPWHDILIAGMTHLSSKAQSTLHGFARGLLQICWMTVRSASPEQIHWVASKSTAFYHPTDLCIASWRVEMLQTNPLNLKQIYSRSVRCR
jgi:hypothetical protein